MKHLLALFFCAIFASTAFAQTPPQLQLDWVYTRGTGGVEQGFIVERKLGPITSAGPYQEIARILSTTIRQYFDTTITAETEYCYRVAAFNTTPPPASVEQKSWSPQACGTRIVALQVPGMPVSLKISQNPPPLPTVSVDWESPAKPSKLDWVSLYETAAPDSNNYQDKPDRGIDYWVYTKGAASGKFSVVAPKPGSYNFRL